jgi:hypothetical protein
MNLAPCKQEDFAPNRLLARNSILAKGRMQNGASGEARFSATALGLQNPGMEFASEIVVKAALWGLKISEVATTLSPDGRSRKPHLKTWRDGWRHLRFLVLHSPTWLFLYPGFALLCAGSLGIAILLPGPIHISKHTVLDISHLASRF